MSPAQEALAAAEIAGCQVFLKDGFPCVSGKPNAALMAALKANKSEIVKLLGGTPEPEFCERCEAWVFCAVDSENFCRIGKTKTTPDCEFRLRVRQR